MKTRKTKKYNISTPSIKYRKRNKKNIKYTKDDKFLVFHHSVGVEGKSRQLVDELMQNYINCCAINNFDGYNIKNIFTTNSDTTHTDIKLIYPINIQSSFVNIEEFKNLKRKLKILNFIEIIENDKQTKYEEKISI